VQVGLGLLGILLSTLAVLCTQQRCSRVWGYTLRRAAQKPIAPFTVANWGAKVRPRCFRSMRSSRQLCSLSRCA
jgi:hypothetical protein